MLSILEARYQHVLQKIIAAWGNPREFDGVYRDLMFDARGNRGGWPSDVWIELELLQTVHKLAYGSLIGVPAIDDDTIKWI